MTMAMDKAHWSKLLVALASQGMLCLLKNRKMQQSKFGLPVTATGSTRKSALTNSVCLNNASLLPLSKYLPCQGYELSGETAPKNNNNNNNGYF